MKTSSPINFQSHATLAPGDGVDCNSLGVDDGLQFNSRIHLDTIVTDSPLCSQTASWFSEPPSPQSRENSPLLFWENMSDLINLQEEMQEFTAEASPEKHQELHSGDKGGVNLSAVETDCECVTPAGPEALEPDENMREHGSCASTDEMESPLPLCSEQKPQNETGLADTEEVGDASREQSPDTVVGGLLCTQEPPADDTTPQKNPEAGQGLSSRSYVLGYLTGKLSEVYRDAEKRLQDTRDLIGNVGVGEMKLVLSQYVTMISKEFPLIHQRPQPPLEPEPRSPDTSKVQLVDLCKDGVPGVNQSKDGSVVVTVAAWPVGSVSSLTDTSPQVYHQWLVQLPPSLSRLQKSSSQQIERTLETLAPQTQGQKLLSVFWLKTADSERPIPKPAGLLLSEERITVMSAAADPENTLTVVRQFSLCEIKEIQIGLAGQHVRLISSTNDSVLAVFTHSKDLSQLLCRALLKALRPQGLSDETHAHPLLSDDLAVLSLDWMSKVSDIVLDGLYVTSRFKRVLADLLYIVHGNMEGPVKPSLANVHPLLYTSVKVQNSSRVTQDTIVQFLLTDSHLALLREDAVFHPVPRGSGLVPAWPQFQGVELRSRSDIRCLLVRQKDDCLLVEIVFRHRKPRGSGRRSDSWKLSFGCTAEAHQLIRHLCEPG